MVAQADQLYIAHAQPGLQLAVFVMVGTKIDPGIGVDTGVAGDVLPQIAVSTAADIEARVAVVIARGLSSSLP